MSYCQTTGKISRPTTILYQANPWTLQTEQPSDARTRREEDDSADDERDSDEPLREKIRLDGRAKDNAKQRGWEETIKG